MSAINVAVFACARPVDGPASVCAAFLAAASSPLLYEAGGLGVECVEEVSQLVTRSLAVGV
jgi:hypothetical protein